MCIKLKKKRNLKKTPKKMKTKKLTQKFTNC